MLRFLLPVLGLAGLLAACSPTLDWREVRTENGGLSALLPCKPDKAARQVVMAGRPVELAGMGCKAAGATFALMQADIGDATQAAEVLAGWNQATLAALKAQAPATTRFVPPGATDLAGSLRVSARGQQPDGAALQSEAAYFARGSRIYQAVVFAPQPTPDMLQPFFESLKLQ